MATNPRHADRPTVTIARCHGCKSALTPFDAAAGNVVKTDKKLYHKQHFCCTFCETPLSGNGYCELNSKVCCAECFKERVCPACTECKRSMEDEAVELFGRLYHKDCVKCSLCRNPLANGEYLLRTDANGLKQVVDEDCYYSGKYKLKK